MLPHATWSWSDGSVGESSHKDNCSGRRELTTTPGLCVWTHRQEDLWEFKAILVYISSFSTTRATKHRVSKQQQNQNQPTEQTKPIWLLLKSCVSEESIWWCAAIHGVWTQCTRGRGLTVPVGPVRHPDPCLPPALKVPGWSAEGTRPVPGLKQPMARSSGPPTDTATHPQRNTRQWPDSSSSLGVWGSWRGQKDMAPPTGCYPGFMLKCV